MGHCNRRMTTGLKRTNGWGAVMVALLLWPAACQNPASDVNQTESPDKSEVKLGKADGADLCMRFGYAPDCDLCQEFGWYGDEFCDQDLIDMGICRGPDPDCQPANDCVAGGGECVALTPSSCKDGTWGDADTYSCGGMLGVACCLPRDSHCDDGTTPMCEMVPPNCEDGTILAYQHGCYSCVDPDTCQRP